MTEASVSFDRIVADVGAGLLGSEHLHFFSALFDLHFVLSFLNFYFEIILDLQIHFKNATEFPIP